MQTLSYTLEPCYDHKVAFQKIKIKIKIKIKFNIYVNF
jgi:hypothetical protein